MSSIAALPLYGCPIRVSALPQLTAHRGRLLSAHPERGAPVHAASFIRRREIVLETELLASAGLAAIAIHEVFHFAWTRLGNARRAAYAALLTEERRARARGELGESAALKKETGPYTRDYVCESFCDTAAWLYAPGSQRHVTLAGRWRARRRAWFAANFGGVVRV